MSPSFFITALLAVSALAAPTAGPSSCSLDQVQLSLPSNQTALAAPTSVPSFVLLGVGVQNYTCTAAGTYTSAGAVAELFDISCLAKTPTFVGIQDIAMVKWQAEPETTPSRCADLVNSALKLLSIGQHYFVTSPSGTGTSPVWDMRASGPKGLKGNPNAMVLAAKVANLPAPTGPQDVDWLQLKSVSGGLATAIYRTDTREGTPPASCTPGSALISVKYTSKYWLYGSSV